MREQPTLRIPLGILALLAALTVYGVVVATFVPPLIGYWPGLAQAAIYLVLGLVWLLPLRRFLIWMETGSWVGVESGKNDDRTG
jgi:membrane protease YdiL (CAAX protease family)